MGHLSQGCWSVCCCVSVLRISFFLLFCSPLRNGRVIVSLRTLLSRIACGLRGSCRFSRLPAWRSLYPLHFFVTALKIGFTVARCSPIRNEKRKNNSFAQLAKPLPCPAELCTSIPARPHLLVCEAPWNRKSKILLQTDSCSLLPRRTVFNCSLGQRRRESGCRTVEPHAT